MGSVENFIPVSKAAEILGRPVSYVRSLYNQGLVRRKVEGSRVFVRVDDITEVHRLNMAGEMEPGELVKRLLLLEIKVARMEKAMDLVFKVNEIQASQFDKIPDAELFSLYNNLVLETGVDEWTVERMLSCCEVYMKITECEIDRLNELLKIDHSWKTFLELNLKQTRYIRQHPEGKTNLELQRVTDLLSHGRKNIRAIATIFIEKSAVFGPSQKLLATMAATDLEAFDELARQSGRRNERGKHALV